MAQKYLPLTNTEEDNDVSWYKAGAAGIASGVIKIPEGIVSLAAELMDLGADTDTAADVEQFFDKLNPFEEIAEENAVGKLTQALVQIAVPGTAGFKLGTKAANGIAKKLGPKALAAKRGGNYANLKNKNLSKATNKALELNNTAKAARFAAGVMGGATGETFVADVEDIGTFGDFFEGSLTEIDREEGSSGSEDASRKLLNRIKFGSESILLTPFVYGVGRGAKALGTRGKELAYSNSKFERWVDKYIGSPLRPRGDLPDVVFKEEMVKQSLKARDVNRATEIMQNITREVDDIFPDIQGVLDKSARADKQKFMKDINGVLFGGDINKKLDKTQIDGLNKIIKGLKNKKVSAESRDNIVQGLNNGREEFSKLSKILRDNSKGTTKAATAELKDIFKNRIEGLVGNTYRMFENNNGLFKFFRQYEPTDESYVKAISTFRKTIAEKAGDVNFTGAGKKYGQEAKEIVDNIIAQARKIKKPTDLPDFSYAVKTMGAKGKPGFQEFKIGLAKNSEGSSEQKKALKELFGEIKDPRYSIYNGITNLSTIARTTAFLSELQTKNLNVQKTIDPATGQNGRGFFWSDKETARRAVNQTETGIELVKVNDLLSEIPGTKNLVSPFSSGTYTTKEIAEGLKSMNDVVSGLQGFVRGDKTGSSAEAAASWFYRNLLLFPKGISQMSKTIFSIPTHLRNFFSAGAFTAANGILFDGLQNPKLLASAFKEGIDVSGLLKLGPKSAKAQESYRELVELGVVNSQVQIGDLTNLLRDTNGGVDMLSTDAVLKPMFNKLKKIKEFFQGKYIAEDDTFKITNYVVELDRIKKAAAKRAGKDLDNFNKTLSPDDLKAFKVEAADIVKNTVPNYAYVGSAVKTARLLPIGNFMSFPSEIFRTTTNIAGQGLKELRHSRPTRGSNVTPTVFDIEAGTFVKNDAITRGTYGTGFKRISGMAATLTGVPIAVTEGAKALYDVSEDEIDALRRFVPEWSKNSTLVPLRLDDGELRYIDFSKSNAYDVVARPFRTVMNNLIEGQKDGETILSGFVDGVNEATGEIMNPFISESIWTEAMTDLVVRGGRTKEGKELYTEQTAPGDKLAIRFMHLGNALVPSYKQGQRILNASFGTPDKRGEVLDIGPELAGFMGLRPIKVDPMRSMGFKISGYQRGMRNARKEFTGGVFGLLKGGRITSEDIIERYIKSNRARFGVQKEMFKDIDAANTLGTTDITLRNEFKNRQVSPRSFNLLNRNKFDPYFPSDDIIQKFREDALALGDASPFNEARSDVLGLQRDFKNLNLDQRFAVGGPVLKKDDMEQTFSILKKIEKELSFLDLSDEFEIDLNEYLPEKIKAAQAPVVSQQAPVTPEVSKEALATNNIPVTQTGLTPTELALLSPEEQQIRLRGRGIV